MNLAFDRAYYQKFYFDPRTAVTTEAEMRARAQLISAYAAHIGLPVRRILDAGCGTGMLRKPLEDAHPKARYVGLDVSEYLCQRFGWEQGTVDSWRSPTPFDLVVCYDVLVVAWLCLYAFFVSRAGRSRIGARLRRSLERVTGTVMIGLGVRLAFEHR